VFLIKARDLFSWMMGKLEAEVMQALPADFSDSERLELSAAFRAAVEAVRDDRANALALQELQGVLREALQEDGDRLSREEIQGLIEALDRVSGRGGPGAGGASENPPHGPLHSGISPGAAG
jgi:hypothetical protein